MKQEIEVSLKSKDDILKMKVNATINKANKEIYYVETDNNKTVVIYDYENNILKRDNLEMYMEYNFNNCINSKILVKSLGKEINPNIKTIDIKQTNNNIMVKYMMENETYCYKIKM